MIIKPAILEETFEDVNDKVAALKDLAPIIQLDVIDGEMYPVNTFLHLTQLDNIETKANFEIHLMCINPLPYLDKKIKKVAGMCMQVESEIYVERFIEDCRKHGYSCGLSILIDTPIEILAKWVGKVDFIQFMTIIAGQQGNNLVTDSLERVASFRMKYPKAFLQCDGGLKEENLRLVMATGVNALVIGSEIQNSANPSKTLLNLEKEAQKFVVKGVEVKQPLSSPTLHVTMKPMTKIKKIGMLGGAAWKEHEQTYKDAFEVSKILAENGYEIVNGGGPGVMKASTEGAHAGNGRALAITYHPNKPKRHYEGVDPGNNFDDEIITLDYFDRTKVMLQNTDVHIVFKGSLGTLSEFGMTWISSWIHEPNSKPIILYGNFWREFLTTFSKLMVATDAEKQIIKVCTTPKEVLDFVVGLG